VSSAIGVGAAVVVACVAQLAVMGRGIARRHRAAYLGALFLAIWVGIGNGVGHLALSARQGGDFPGTDTAPLALVAGLALLRTLHRSQRADRVIA